MDKHDVNKASDAFDAYFESLKNNGGLITCDWDDFYAGWQAALSVTKGVTKCADTSQGDPVAAINRTSITGNYEFYPCSGAVDLPIGVHKLYAAQPADGEWVSCTDRLPTESDADDNGYVWGWYQCRHEAMQVSPHMFVSDSDICTHWMPTGLTRPQPPEAGEKVMSDALKALDKLIPPPSSKVYQHYQPHYKAIRDKIESMEQEIKALNKCVDSQRRMLQSSQARVAELEAEQPADGVPEGWKIRRMPYDTMEVGKIQVSSPFDNHCMVERREQMAPHHPMNMFYALAEELMPQPQKREEL